MSALGSEKKPIVVKVTSEETVAKVAEICNKNNLYFIAGFEEVEDLSQLELALKEKAMSKDVYAPCSCGSGAKYKFCCMKK